MSKQHYVRRETGSKNRPSEKELDQLFGKLAELVDTIAESRHIETMEAYRIIDRILTFYQ